MDEGKGLAGGLWKRVCDGRLKFNNEDCRQLGIFYAAAQIEGAKDLGLEAMPEALKGQIEATAVTSDVNVSRGERAKYCERASLDEEMR